MLNYSFRGMDMCQLAVWFFIYSFLGWAMECIVIRKQLGYWENRGFAKLPFCVIYGFGVFIAFNTFAPIENNYPAIYAAGCICATAFEYMTARIMLKLFGEVWWNYDHERFNYKVHAMDERLVSVIGPMLTICYLIDFSYHFFRRLEMDSIKTAVNDMRQRHRT